MVRRKTSKKRRLYDGKSYWELLWGPADWRPDGSTVEELRDDWENGGRQEVMRHNRDPGKRPWAFWEFDVTEFQKRRADKHFDTLETDVTQAEWILFLGLADEAEKRAIEEENVIEEQREKQLIEEAEREAREARAEKT